MSHATITGRKTT